jgi:hypothetical protein
MSASIEQNTENARVTDGMAGNAAKQAVEGGAAVKDTVSAMKSIAEKIGIIDDIAYQTKPSIPTKLRRAIRLRNALVPVIDLGAHFGGRPIKVGSGTSIVILKVTSGDRMQMIGVVVDAVGKVLEIPPSGNRTTRGLRQQDPKRLHPRHGHGQQPYGHLARHRARVLANEFVVLRSAVQSVAQENIPI